jgi:hypothetical protein
MGYECHFKYHERIDGEYNKEEIKILKKKIGDPFEEISLQKLAASVMAQLARRDIWIVDVEIFELTKKQITFKETKGGVLIKNRKFLFDGQEEDIASIIVEAIPQENQMNIVGEASQPVRQVANQHPHNAIQSSSIDSSTKRPIGQLVFAPEPQQIPEIKQKNLKFTVDNKYAIYERKSSPLGDMLTVIDDTGRQQTISDKFFVPVPQLFADDELGFSENQQQRDGGKLYWGSANSDSNMPDIRRR